MCTRPFSNPNSDKILPEQAASYATFSQSFLGPSVSQTLSQIHRLFRWTSAIPQLVSQMTPLIFGRKLWINLACLPVQVNSWVINQKSAHDSHSVHMGSNRFDFLNPFPDPACSV